MTFALCFACAPLGPGHLSAGRRAPDTGTDVLLPPHAGNKACVRIVLFMVPGIEEEKLNLCLQKKEEAGTK